MKKNNAVIAVVCGDKVAQMSADRWEIIMACAGQMIDDGYHIEYYTGIHSKKVIDSIQENFSKLKNITL